MQGVNEIEITASRTGQWAAMDPPTWGPTIEHTFRGEFENDDGTTRQTKLTLRLPEWCRVTVYRDVGGKQRQFTEELSWLKSYGRAGFRSEVPNQRWQIAPRQMLHKRTKASVLRAGYPGEEGFGFTAEGMEGRETEAGGIVIDGKAEQEPTGSTERNRLADDSYPDPLAPLEERDQTIWLKNLFGCSKRRRQSPKSSRSADITASTKR